MMTTHWSSAKERSNPFSLKLIRWIALNLSRPVARLCLYPISLYFLLTSPRTRKASREFLARLPGYTGNTWQIARHIHSFASTILDRVYFLTDQFERFDIEIEGKQELDDLVQQGRGCILLGAHVGSFEVLRCLAKKNQLPLNIMMYVDQNAMITQVLNELNPAMASSVIDLADYNALLKAKEVVDKGELLGMLGDRHHADEKFINASLLGDSIHISSGAATLASVLKTPVVMFFGLYLGANRYKIIFKKLAETTDVPRQQRQQFVNDSTRQYVANIEDIIRQHPYNWFNFYDFWETAQ